MADTTVSLTTMTAGSLSGDLITTAEGGTTVSAGNTAVIDVGGHTGDVIFTFYAASAATATVEAGDKPPAERSGLGATSALTLPAGDVLLLCVEGARFAQDNGTIRIAIATNDTVVGAYRIPRTI